MNEGVLDAIKRLTRTHQYDFDRVSNELNEMIASGKHPEWGAATQCYSSDDCRLTFSAAYKAAAAKKRESQPSKAKPTSPPKNVKKIIESIETFADAVKFEQDLARESKEKREEIFQRVMSTFQDLGIDTGGEDRPKFELPADIMYALSEQERKREMERERAERIERERKEKMEIEEARARLRSRFDEGSEDAEGIDPLAHLNDKPREPELPMTQEELLYEAAPSIPIDAILFSDEFEEALASIEKELEQTAASKSDDGTVSELGEVLAFLDEEAQKNPNPTTSSEQAGKQTIQMPPQELESQPPSQVISPPVKESIKAVSAEAQPMQSRLDGSEKARAIILQKLHEAGNGDLTLVARSKEDGRQELVGKQGQRFVQSSPAAAPGSQRPTLSSSSSSSQTADVEEFTVDANGQKMVGRMHYGALSPNQPNGRGGTRLNIVEGEDDDDEDGEDDDDRYIRERREQKIAAQAAMLRKQEELERLASSKLKEAIHDSEDDIQEDGEGDVRRVDEGGKSSNSASMVTMPPLPPNVREEQRSVNGIDNVHEDVDSSAENKDSDCDEQPAISGIGRCRRENASSAAKRKERMKNSFRKLESRKNEKEVTGKE